MTPPLHLRVFLASPGDVADERALAHNVLAQLAYAPGLRGKVTFEIVAWDQPGAGIPMLATLTPQEAINQGLPKPSQCDIVVVILWSRMGTPLPPKYVKADGSRYLSGTEWEFVDAREGNKANGRPEILLYRRKGEPQFTPSALKDKDDPLAQWQNVQAFFAAFRNPDGSIEGGVNEYATPEDFRTSLDEHLKRLVFEWVYAHKPDSSQHAFSEPLSVAAPLWQGSPFPGLRPFTPADAPVFFGRGREADALVHRLENQATRCIAIVAASGSGKSSLIAAGLLPRLKANAVEGSKDWLLPDVIPSGGERRQWTGLHLTPGELGDNPFQALAVKLVPLLSDAVLTPGKVAARLESELAAVKAYVDDALREQPKWAELLIFIDQFEELFSVVAERYRAKFIELLVAITQAPRVRTIVTMRADFYHRCLEWPTLAELLRETTFSLAAPGVVALHEMITKPAARAGLDFDDGVPDRILEDAGTDPGGLALLAFALHEVYEARTPQGRLTLLAYEAFGGVKGAISKRAEGTFEKLSLAAQGLHGGVFRELVEVNEFGVATRRRAKLVNVASSTEARDLVDAFTEARLLVTDRAPDGTPMVEVAHEALLREWPRLRDWIGERADDLRAVRQVEAAAAEWRRAAGDVTHFWPHERQVSAFEAFSRLGMTYESLAEPARSFLRPEAERLLEELERPYTTHYRRAEIGDRLAQIDDPRPGVGLREDGLPDIFWCEVPGGKVRLDDKQNFMEVTPFRIAKYPVTYRQYKAFLEDLGGYRQRELWWQGLKHEAKPGEQYRLIDNCPADKVSWYDAVAFCRWLDARLRDRDELPIGRQVRLPTEWEWQQAATGGRLDYRYPWGPEWIDGYANTGESRLNRTTAVGMYPAGASPVGALDMAGDVWERCLNTYGNPPGVGGEHGRECGGSFLHGYVNCTCLFHVSDDLVGRGDHVGFRVCCAAPIL